MRRILLDTSAFSAFMRGSEAAGAAVREAEEILLSPVVLGELRAGFARGRMRRRNEAELEEFMESPRVAVVDIDEDTSLTYAEILTSLRAAGTPIPANDTWIAASAMQHGLVIVTTDPHFAKIRQVLSVLI